MADTQNLHWYSSAVLIWLPEGEVPDPQSIDPADVRAPPSPNPEPWWRLIDAVTHAMTVDRQGHRKRPWIKTGEQVLAPEAVEQLFGIIQNLHFTAGDLDQGKV